MSEQISSVTGQGYLKVAKAGVANASKAIGMMTPDSLNMDILWAGSVPTPRLSEISGNPEDLVIGAYVRVTGDAPGHALLLFPRESAMILADLVLNQPVGTTTELGALEESLIQEVANILTSSYITAIADNYQVTLLPDPPLMALDMAAAIVDNVLISTGHFEPETLSIVTRFRGNTQTVDGFFLYIPEAIASVERQVA